jgi:putative two-component system response regulator
LVGTPVNTMALKEQVHDLVHLNTLDPQERLRLFQTAADSGGPGDDLRRSHLETLEVLGVAMGMKNPAMGDHLRNVGTLAGILSDRLGMGSKYGLAVSKASTLHDIGQIGMPDEILAKPTPLDVQERALIKSHCRQGAQILAQGHSPYLRMAAEIALSHHEHWDGSGYPHGLRGEAIPFSARIVAVCDVYDELRSRRCYKPALDHVQAVQAMFAGDGRTRADHFDPLVLMAFHDAADDLQAIYAPSAEPVFEAVSA